MYWRKPITKIRLFSNRARSGANPPKGFHSSAIKSLQHKVAYKRYLSRGCFDYAYGFAQHDILTHKQSLSLLQWKHCCKKWLIAHQYIFVRLLDIVYFRYVHPPPARSADFIQLVGFHLAQQDFTCRKANFIARTYLYAPGEGGRGRVLRGYF